MGLEQLRYLYLDTNGSDGDIDDTISPRLQSTS